MNPSRLVAADGAVCPVCDGRRLYLLTFSHSADCALQARTDARRAADDAILGISRGPWTRSTTPAERSLLSACGIPFAAVPDLVTVGRLTPAIIEPTWAGINLGTVPTSGRVTS